MRIGINLLYLIPGVVGGTETYARASIEKLLRTSDHEYVLFVNRNQAEGGQPFAPRAPVVNLGVDARSRIRRYVTEQFLLPTVARQRKVDLIHSMGYVSVLRTDIPTVVTIHDLNYKHIDMPFSKRTMLRWFISQSAKRSGAIVTVSEFSKQEICEEFGVPAERVWVTYNAPNEDVFSAGRLPVTESRQPFILALSSFSPHKNIGRLMVAFEQISKRYPEMRLVIAGRLPPSLTVNDRLKDRIEVKGYVSRDTLLHLYRSALCFVMPSLYEGFGIPLIEAMALGTPAATSNRGSLPEVGGEVPLYFDPLDVEQMADALLRIIESTELRESMINAGRARAMAFRWDESVERLKQVYESVSQ